MGNLDKKAVLALAIMELTDGKPTTLHDGLERYLGRLKTRGNVDQRQIEANLQALLDYSWPGEASRG